MENTSLAYKLMLTIDQISQITGIRKSTLRYWEKCFAGFLKPPRTHSNRREYAVEDLDRIKVIQRLLEQEHLTAYGVRVRLQELFSSPGEAERGRNARVKTVRKSPSSSAAGKNLSVH
jgi:DNA-binding transcriptional MerR regulator